MRISRWISLMAMAATLSACGKSGTHNSQLEGYWIPQTQAQELRATGQLGSVCKGNTKGQAKVADVRLIDSQDDIYAYDPTIGKGYATKLGELDRSGSFRPVGQWREQIGPAQVRVRVEGNLLELTYSEGRQYHSELYSRSSLSEVKHYYSARAACVH